MSKANFKQRMYLKCFANILLASIFRYNPVSYTHLHAQFIHILAILPWFIVSILLITVISNSMDTLKMGDSIAISLGENVKLTKIISTITVILLSSSSVAIAGPISFVGLITPHIVSKFGVRNFRGNFILCGIYGGNLLLLSDIVSKLLKYPYESPEMCIRDRYQPYGILWKLML